MPSELKITMLGHRGVGKTSILTAMYEQFDTTIGEAGLQLTPDLESSALLSKRLGELKALLNDFEATGGLEGTEGHKSFKFGLGKLGGKPNLQLSFQDFPGEYLQNNCEFVSNVVKECAAVLIAIDTPPLMEANGRWHDLINNPKQITDFFKIAYADLEEPKLVLLVPVRCEKYVQNEQDAKKLTERIKDKYSGLLRLFNSENLLTKVACVVTPVQTVGTVFFSQIKEIDGKPNFYFRKIDHHAEYSPQDSDQPLRYLLRFVLKLHLDTKRGWFNRIRRWLGWDEYLKEAARKSAEKCKHTGGFEILQGLDLLDIKK
ncbi:hypothetical protein CLI64_17750 [Nostoc sp. CENA543]|uniref:hypothetical protein n=1 Tax=Nostoc sp. CENA543 TaxID=1869241 RepID=UPI000CA311BE|nr:hypothetical protein [Nostoc sp. CENA543]AUT02079.1 hypothetical protein CLI64_17750 [Nostoc sp. CENA543]